MQYIFLEYYTVSFTYNIYFLNRPFLFHIVYAHAYIGHVAHFFSIIGDTIHRWGQTDFKSLILSMSLVIISCLIIHFHISFRRNYVLFTFFILNNLINQSL